MIRDGWFVYCQRVQSTLGADAIGESKTVDAHPPSTGLISYLWSCYFEFTWVV